MTSTITIYHGYEASGRMVDSLSDDSTPEVLVKKYSYETDRTILELIYRDNQAVDGHEQNVRNKARSLSVGDVIGFRPEGAPAGVEIFTVVSTFGFDPIGYDKAIAIPRITQGELDTRRAAVTR